MSLKIEVDTVNVVVAGTPIRFGIPFENADYLILRNCYNSGGEVGIHITEKTVNGFTVTPLEDATFEYKAVAQGITTQTSIQSETRSTAVVTAGTPIVLTLPFATSSYLIFAICYNSGGEIGYTISGKTTTGFTVTPLEDATFDWEATEVGSSLFSIGRLSRDWTLRKFYNEALRDITKYGCDALPFERFTLCDRGIQKAVGALWGILAPDYMTPDEATVTAGAYGNEISLRGVRLMHAGQEIQFELAAKFADGTRKPFLPIGKDEIEDWRPNSPLNTTKLVYAYAGDGTGLQIRQGSEVTESYVVLLRYPRVPIKALYDDEAIDAPDGSIMEAAILSTSSLMLQRYGKMPPPDRTKEALDILQRVYQQFGVALSTEELKQKAKALL